MATLLVATSTNGSSCWPKSIRQEGNQAGGNIAGRDIIVEAPAKPENALARLFRRLKEEVADDQSLTEHIRELEIFTTAT